MLLFQVPRGVYDKLATTDSPLGKRLKSDCVEQMEDLFRRACLPPADIVGRRGLPGVFDKDWFCKTYCKANKGELRTPGKEPIWDAVRAIPMPSSVALMASSPQLLLRYFAPTKKTVRGIGHQVVGVGSATGATGDAVLGVVEERVMELAELMFASFLKGVTMDWSYYQMPRWARKTMVDGKHMSRNHPSQNSSRPSSTSTGRTSGTSMSDGMPQVCYYIFQSIFSLCSVYTSFAKLTFYSSDGMPQFMRKVDLADKPVVLQRLFTTGATAPRNLDALGVEDGGEHGLEGDGTGEIFDAGNDLHLFQFEDQLRRLLEAAMSSSTA
jgi:hypothetical protein